MILPLIINGEDNFISSSLLLPYLNKRFLIVYSAALTPQGDSHLLCHHENQLPQAIFSAFCFLALWWSQIRNEKRNGKIIRSVFKSLEPLFSVHKKFSGGKGFKNEFGLWKSNIRHWFYSKMKFRVQTICLCQKSRISSHSQAIGILGLV